MSFEKAYYSIGYLDRLSYGDTIVHRLDPRMKVLSTFLFLIAVVSFPKYEVTALVPFFLFPVLLIALGDIPPRFVLSRVLIVSPFAVLVGMFNPVFDKAIVIQIFGISISGGWVSFVSIVLKFTLSISAAILLVATTSFPGVCHALSRLGLPKPFTTQLVFLYRYMFVLMEEALRIVRARDMRTFGRKGTGLKVFIRRIGMLFVRTMARAERIYNAMLSRGFRGEMPSIKQHRLTVKDLLFALLTLAFFSVCRILPVTEIIGGYFNRIAG